MIADGQTETHIIQSVSAVVKEGLPEFLTVSEHIQETHQKHNSIPE